MGFFDFGSINVNQANAYETASLPGEGDVNAGAGGITTSALTNENDLAAFGLDTYGLSSKGEKYADGSALYDVGTGQKVGHALTPKLSGNPTADHPFITVGILILGLFAFRKWGKKDATISNVAYYGTSSMLFFLLAKFLFGTVNIASVSPTVEFV